MSLLSLAENTERVVCPTATARFGTVTLHRVSASVGADAGPKPVCLPWTF